MIMFEARTSEALSFQNRRIWEGAGFPAPFSMRHGRLPDYPDRRIAFVAHPDRLQPLFMFVRFQGEFSKGEVTWAN